MSTTTDVPRLVRIITLLCLFASIAAVIGGTFLLRPDAHEATIAAMRLRTELGSEENVAVVSSVFRVTAVFLFAIGALGIFCAYGLHRRLRWARPLTMWLALILGFWWGMGALSVAASPWFSATALVWNLFGALVCATIMYAMNLPVAKRHFPQPLDMHAQRLRRKTSRRR